jgi:hypothetical protein
MSEDNFRERGRKIVRGTDWPTDCQSSDNLKLSWRLKSSRDGDRKRSVGEQRDRIRPRDAGSSRRRTGHNKRRNSRVRRLPAAAEEVNYEQ